jgi:predicted dienelactone hydrolase
MGEYGIADGGRTVMIYSGATTRLVAASQHEFD